MRNPANWQVYAQGSQPAMIYGGRGYTGHEQLNQFGIINMNARLYDPLLARFLAPDPFVASGMTNDFNRYIYARNNPMMYTDPDGKNIFFFIGLVIYTAINYAIKVRDNHGEMNPTKWNNNSFTIGYSSYGGFYGGISFDDGYHSANIGYGNNGLTVGSTNNGVTTMEPVDYTPKPINFTINDNSRAYERDSKVSNSMYIKDLTSAKYNYGGVSGLTIDSYRAFDEMRGDQKWGGVLISLSYTSIQSNGARWAQNITSDFNPGGVITSQWDDDDTHNGYYYTSGQLKNRTIGNTVSFYDRPASPYSDYFPSTFTKMTLILVNSYNQMILKLYYGYFTNKNGTTAFPLTVGYHKY